MRTDPTRVRQIIDGLAENALRVTPAGAPIVLAVAPAPAGGGVLLEVRDGGPGLTDDDLRRRVRARRRCTSATAASGGSAPASGWPWCTAWRPGWAARAEAGRAPEGGARFAVRLPLRRRRSPLPLPRAAADARATPWRPRTATPASGRGDAGRAAVSGRGTAA